jgi:hypothetical protein
MTQEVLEAGQPARPRRRQGMPTGLIWTLGIITLVVLTLASLAVISDLTARTVEDELLISAVEKSESAMKATQDEFSAVLDEYDAQDLSDADRAELLDRLGEVAAAGEVAIAEAGVGVADVPILPWHTKIIAAQDAYLAHNVAWVNYMSAAAEDPTEWFQPQPDVNSTFSAAKEPLVAAIPLLDVTNLLPRVRAIFDDGGGESDGGASNGDGQAA